jgi:hypothetical protein
MKKILLIFAVCWLASFYTQAQTNGYAEAKERLRKNENAIQELSNLLMTDYTQVMNTSSVVPANTFKFGESIVLTSFGDVAINQQASQMEAEFNQMFDGSTWKFTPESKSANSTVSVSTKAGQTETSNYNCSGSAMITINGLIEGMAMNIQVFQNKADKTSFLFLFSPNQGLLVVTEVKK